MRVNGGRKPRLLVLDSRRYHMLFDAVLSGDYEVIATADPGEAIAMAATEGPDLVLVSSSADKSEGIKIVKAMRESATFKAPILLMLTTDRPTLRREAEKAGCNGFLIKPITPEKLRLQISSLLNGSAL
jgi:CheY-like chemotaxis protein